MTDRTYLQIRGLAWHAEARPAVGLCGVGPPSGGYLIPLSWVRRDRVPPDGHLCGRCARVIAARTDVESEGFTGAPV